MKKTIVIILCCLSLVGCFSLNPFDKAQNEKDETLQEIAANDVVLKEKTKQYGHAAKSLLEDIPTEKQQPQTVIATDMLDQQEKIIGKPIEPIDIDKLLNLYEKNINDYKKALSESEEDLNKILKENVGLQAKVDHLNTVIANRTWYGDLWYTIMSWSLSTFLLAGVGLIILLIIAPTMIPRIIAWGALKIPKLIGFIGVTSVKVVDNIVSGLQEARVELSKKGDNEKMSVREVRAILDNHLERQLDIDTKNAVKERKNALKLQRSRH